jgi:hypothetical protein
MRLVSYSRMNSVLFYGFRPNHPSMKIISRSFCARRARQLQFANAPGVGNPTCLVAPAKCANTPP